MFVSTPISLLLAVPTALYLNMAALTPVWFWSLLFVQVKATDALMYHQAQTALLHFDSVIADF
jgi:hypothetical protein